MKIVILNKKVEIKFKHITQHRIRYAETDKMGYCYYGNYPIFLEVGRVELFRALGISYKSLEDNGILLPVLDLNIKYIAPALYDDLIRVDTALIRLDGVRLFFDYSIYNEDDVLLIRAATTLVFVDANNRKPIAPAQNFISLITPYVY